MTRPIADEDISLLRANEYIRQARESFDQHKRQDGRGFMVWLAMNWMAALLLPGFAAICAVIILHPERYSSWAVNTATSTLLVDVFGAVLAVWRSMTTRPTTRLSPTLTDEHLPPVVPHPRVARHRRKGAGRR
jgi:hypothetical protein